MEYQKIVNLDDTVSHPSKFRIRNWVEINYEHEEHIKMIMIIVIIIIIIIIITMIIIITLNLKRQWWGQVYVITVMHTYLLKELQ